MFPEKIHIQIAMRIYPVLVHFNRQCPDQAQAALFIGEDPHNSGPAPDLLVQPLQHVG